MSNNVNSQRKIKILSIDGGGIRGIYAAKILAEFETYLTATHHEKKIWQHFDLITGTSTGGIIAIALGLGIPATRIFQTYLEGAKQIFGNKRGFFASLWASSHERKNLEFIIRCLFAEYNCNKDPILGDSKTHLAIPIYDFSLGAPRILKTQYNDVLNRDSQIPAYMAALATSAAPTFFDPYSNTYQDSTGLSHNFFNNIDGGLFAVNPSLGCLLEVQDSLDVSLSNISMLSIGSGQSRTFDNTFRRGYGLVYWFNKKRLIEAFFQAQAQEVENLIGILCNGIGKRHPDRFTYLRLNFDMSGRGNLIVMDEYKEERLSRLAVAGQQTWNLKKEKIVTSFIN